jgi:aryl-alcohol dehydrogenase-like predicted oxidoreductase
LKRFSTVFGDGIVEHDPEKWIPAFGKYHAPVRLRTGAKRANKPLDGLIAASEIYWLMGLPRGRRPALNSKARVSTMTNSKNLPTRSLGSSGIRVSAIGLGCMSLSGVYGASNDDEGIALIHEALDQGITLLDTSDAYGVGHNEELVGKAIAGRRQGVVLATKFGNLGGRGGKVADGRPEYVASACEASLRRLGVDSIDIYYQHRIDPTVPVEDTVGAMARLVEQGKVRALGLSEARPETIRRAHAVHPLVAVQNEFSLLYRTEAEETLKTTRDLNIAFVAYAPLGRGLMTGVVDNPNSMADSDSRRRHPRYAEQNLTHNMALVRGIEEIARDRRCTLGQLALAWLLARGEDIVPIPGTKRKERLLENIGALSVRLTEDDLAQISDSIPVGAAAGLRYPENLMKSVYL